MSKLYGRHGTKKAPFCIALLFLQFQESCQVLREYLNCFHHLHLCCTAVRKTKANRFQNRIWILS